MIFVNTDIYKLCALDKSIICFGAGKVLRGFFSKYKEYHLEDKVIAIADNNEAKHGESICIGEKMVPIISLKELMQMKNICVVITCADFIEIYKQLDSYHELKDTLCFVPYYIYSETNLFEDQMRKYPESFRITEKPQIPKKIHYCWFGKNPLPEKNKLWIESWKRNCPDYEIIEWNESNYDITQNKYMHDAYITKKWGFVPDYARLDIIYTHGGIYLDTDVEVVRNLDDLLYQEAFAGVDGSHFVSLGLGFGARKGNQLIKRLRDEYDNVHFMDEKGNIDLTAAPTLQGPIFEKLGFKRNGEQQFIGGMTIYPEKVLAAKCNYTGRIMPTPNTYAIHHYDASWVPVAAKNRTQRNIEFYQSGVVTL